MAKYDLQEISACIERNPAIVAQWFEELEAKLKHHVPVEAGTKLYSEEDLNIASFISEKREENWPLDKIFHKITENFTLKEKPVYAEKTGDFNHDPEALFHEIAQDNEIIRLFKYHSLRVMFLASSLGKRMDCYDEDLRVAALLHDIGKMGISQHMLMKPEKLSDLEFTIIQSHSHIGNAIVRKHLGMTRAAKFIRDHHERWDGKGYPRRLTGDEISIQGRIIGICDAFDTMTIDQRNYKKDTLTYEEAIQELRACSWTQFDGTIVTLFIDMMKELTIPEYMLQDG